LSVDAHRGSEPWDERERPWWRRGLIIIGVWSIPGITSVIAMIGERKGEELEVPLWLLVLQTVHMWALFAALTPAVSALQRRVPAGRGLARRWIPAHLGFAFLFGLAVVAISLPLGAYLDHLASPSEPIDWSMRLWRSPAFVFSAMVIYGLILAVVAAADGARRARREERRAAALERSLAEARLAALRSRLQPHFLFNTLNSISSLVRQQRNDDAIQTIGVLSELLRASLQQEDVALIALREELELAERYLAIEQLRLGDRLRLSFEIEPEAEGVPLPPFLLQPLVENAVQHGIASRPEGGRLTVAARVDGGRLHVEVENDGAVVTTHADGRGLRITRERIAAMYGPHAHLDVRARAEGGVIVGIDLPADGPEPPEDAS
jgi:two-component sensor histidine kinase